MSTQAAMRTYLCDIVGVADVEGTTPGARRVAVQNEGLTVLEGLLEFDDEEIKTLCSSVRKPGDLVADPNDPNRRVVNPGFNILAICEKILKWAAYFAKIYTMIGRTISHDALKRDRLNGFEKHFILLEEHEGPVKLPIVSKTFEIIKVMDLVPSHLRDRIGSCKVPLSTSLETVSNHRPCSNYKKEVV